MKHTKLLLFGAACALLVALLAACAKNGEETEKKEPPAQTTVQLTVTTGRQTLYDAAVTCPGEAPTVAEVLQAAVDSQNAEFTLGENGALLAAYAYPKPEQNFRYTWSGTMNGVALSAPANTVPVTDGDSLVYTLSWGAGTLSLEAGKQYAAVPEEWFRFDRLDAKNHIVQGGCFTGEHFIIAFFESDDPASRIRLAELDTDGNVLRTSEPLDLDHANNIAYQVDRGEILVSHCQQKEADRYAWYSFVNPTDFTVTESGELERPFFSMGYSYEKGLYGSGEWGGQTIDVWDENLKLLRSFDVEQPKTLSQGVWCNAAGIWFVRSSQNGKPCEIRMYDWETGALLFQIPIENMDVEPENITIWGDQVYVVCNNNRLNGGIVYTLHFVEVEKEQEQDA